MSSDQIRWEFAAADDFDADLSTERSFNADQQSATESTYKSLTGQLDGGSGTDQNLSLNRGHVNLYDEVGTAGSQASQGLNDASQSHQTGLQRGLSRLQG
ncbi:MAG: hypothetical protein ACR2KL_01405 [Nocardioidaceae bacterium]